MSNLYYITLFHLFMMFFTSIDNKSAICHHKMLPKVANEMYCDTKPNWLEGEVGGDFVSAKKCAFAKICTGGLWLCLVLKGSLCASPQTIINNGIRKITRYFSVSPINPTFY